MSQPSAAPENMVPQGTHHIAFASRDSKKTYDFYHNQLGMPLVRTENHLVGDGYFRHFFFDMGAGQLIGFFEVHNVGEKKDYTTDFSESAGLPAWVNHVAFKVADEDAYEAIKLRLKENNVALLGEVDHDWCKSVYLSDPNGITLEYCFTQPETDIVQSLEEAHALLFSTSKTQITEDSRKKSVAQD